MRKKKKGFWIWFINASLWFFIIGGLLISAWAAMYAGYMFQGTLTRENVKYLFE